MQKLAGIGWWRPLLIAVVLCAGCKASSPDEHTEGKASLGGDPIIIRIGPPPTSLFPLPAFELTDQNGAKFGSKNLEGKTWVASFFFSRCQTICPKILQSVKAVQVRTEEKGWSIPLVSITVDPEYDTIEILRKKGEEIGADFSRWHFLTTDPESLKKLVMEGFKVAIGEKMKDAEGVMDITHSARLMLIDGEAKVRGLYESTPEGVKALIDRIATLDTENTAD